MISKREIFVYFGVHKIVNEIWTCYSCIQESNSVEWWWQGKPVVNGYLSIRICPKCSFKHEDLK